MALALAVLVLLSPSTFCLRCTCESNNHSARELIAHLFYVRSICHSLLLSSSNDVPS